MEANTRAIFVPSPQTGSLVYQDILTGNILTLDQVKYANLRFQECNVNHGFSKNSTVLNLNLNLGINIILELVFK